MARRSSMHNDVAGKEGQSNKMAEMKMLERVTQADDGNCIDSTLLNNAMCGTSALSYNALQVCFTPQANDAAGPAASESQDWWRLPGGM
ncbi:hypothetical protein E2C01_019000 [Portunus trituberculatus]|uniref:Uncharacterized protein n=1 Tax=Portunus trituberculatus TaxID=210409 RepID=A0A5B7DXV9_PORTR|nr:hypothetical protein [Portunus trituberculatus]